MRIIGLGNFFRQPQIKNSFLEIIIIGPARNSRAAWTLQKKQELFVINGATAKMTATPSGRAPQHEAKPSSS